jgi:prepilin-type processing-associated H-X9-DG protein
MRSTHVPRQAFMLVELLVVIAIIAVLISVLLPALNKAREAADTLACGSNLRQIGVAAHQYIAEFGCYPPAGYKFTGGRVLTWDRLLNRYLGGQVPLEYTTSKRFAEKSLKVFICPSDRVPRAAFGAGTLPQSYSAARPFRRSNGTYSPTPEQDAAGYYRYTTLGVMDWGDATRNPNQQQGTKGEQHINVMRHVKPGMVKKPCIMIVERPFDNNFQGEDASCYTINPQWQTWDGGASSTRFPVSHGSRDSRKFNYLFSDGHIELLTRAESWGHESNTLNGACRLGSMWRRNDMLNPQ